MKIKTDDAKIWFVIVVIVITLALFWASALVYSYIADDWRHTPADERSVPAPRSY